MTTRVLNLDIGNTNITWFCGLGSSDYRAGSSPDLEGLAKSLAGVSIDEVRVSCVIQDGQKRQSLFDSIERYWGTTPQLAKTAPSFGKLTTYYDASQLGVDRWLALLALAEKQDNQCVLLVDAGTALTVDLLLDGEHQGGIIIPGHRLMRQSFYAKTGLIRYQEGEKHKTTQHNWGKDTLSSISLGVDKAIFSFVCSVVDEYRVNYPAGSVIFTGGDGESLHNRLKNHYKDRKKKEDFFFDAYLVCSGLDIYFGSQLVNSVQ